MNASLPTARTSSPGFEPACPAELDSEGAVKIAPRGSAEEVRIAQAMGRHFSLVWRALRRFGVAECTADDAAQQVFLTFSRRLALVEPEQERAFLLSVAVRVAANARRSRDRSREVLSAEELERAPASEQNPEQLLSHKQRRAELDRVLDELPDEQRIVFVLYELEGFSLPEIATTLGIPLGTATSRLGRGRARFEHWVRAHHGPGGSP